MAQDDIEVAPGVVAHPHICSGTPCISGSRIGIRWISGRFYAGESIQDLAHDYDTTSEVIEQAIRYEYVRRCSRKPEMRAIYRDGKSVLVTDREAQRIWKQQVA